MIKLHKKNWQSNRNIMISVALVTTIIGAAIVYGTTTLHHLDKNPVKGTAVEIQTLLDLTGQLGASPNSNNPGQATRDYVDHLRAIEQSCQNIHAYKQISKTSKLSEADRGHVNQSNDLCNDLTKLTAQSETKYVAILPLMNTDTSLRRYQKIGFIARHIKQKHLDATTNAISTLKKSPTQENDFPSTAITDLEQLKTAIQTSHELNYLLELRKFQADLLAERQRFWGPYADSASLKRSLEAQFTGYCQSLQASDTPLKQCSRSR